MYTRWPDDSWEKRAPEGSHREEWWRREARGSARLERVEVEVEVPEAERTCPVTGLPMECIGYETSEKLEYEPGRLSVKVCKRAKYVSPKRNNGVTGVGTGGAAAGGHLPSSR